MNLDLKEQKIRDRIIFYFNIIPVKVDVQRHVVLIDLREQDMERLDLDPTRIETELSILLDRKVEVVAV